MFVARVRAWGGRRVWKKSAGGVKFEGTISFFLF